MDLKEKVAFLKGYVEGKNLLGQNKDESAVLVKILELLDEMATEIEKLDDGQKVICSDMDEIDDDLYDLEQYVYGDDDDNFIIDDEEYDDYDLVACPSCGTQLELEEDDDKNNLVCPSCGKNFTFEEGLEAIEKLNEE